MLTYPWKCTVLHCNHLGNTWKPLVLMTRHFDYCPSASEGDNQSVGSSAPVVSRCFPGGYNVKLCISRGRLAWWLLAFLHSVSYTPRHARIKMILVTHLLRVWHDTFTTYHYVRSDLLYSFEEKITWKINCSYSHSFDLYVFLLHNPQESVLIIQRQIGESIK